MHHHHHQEEEEEDWFQVPIRGADHVVAFRPHDVANKDTAQLDSLFSVLAAEQAAIDTWQRAAIELYRRADYAGFAEIASAIFQSDDILQHYASNAHALVQLLSSLITFHAYTAYAAQSQQDKTHNIHVAKTYLQKAEAINRVDSDFWIAKSLLMMVEGQWEGIRPLINARLEMHKNDLPAMTAKAYVEYHEGHYSDALKLYQAILRENPACSPSVRYGIGICAYQLGVLDIAIEAFRRFLVLVHFFKNLKYQILTAMI
jgi:tetratricopeptide (TPR) repeat protein